MNERVEEDVPSGENMKGVSILNDEDTQGRSVEECESGPVLGEHDEDDVGIQRESRESADPEKDRLVNVERNDRPSYRLGRVDE